MRRLSLAVTLLGLGCPPAAVEVLHEDRPADYRAFWPAKACQNCHERIVTQHAYSAHAASFSNPVFQAQLYGQLVPRLGAEPALEKEASACLACHSPIAHLQNGGKIMYPDEVDPGFQGVTCDFCHTIRGFRGNAPGNANYISVPGETKLGPFKISGNWHHAYSELISRSEFCAICHTTQNIHGLKLRTTYDEWKASSYAARGIQCQDCHMSAKGYLVDGKPVFEQGQVARLTGGRTAPPVRANLHSHRFPGAHSVQQLVGALAVRVVPYEKPLTPGARIKIAIDVDNTNVGHKAPSGSVELRVIWLEVRVAVSDEDTGVALRASPADPKGAPLDVAGASELEAGLLRGDVPAGSRVYRAVIAGADGRPTLTNFEGRRVLFDNRLGAAETRREVYDFVVPDHLEDDNDLHVTATLKYLRYPSVFADGLEVDHAEPVTIAEGTGLVGALLERDQR